MATIHLLNTSPGDCTIIQHNSGRVTMIDICDGNDEVPRGRRAAHSPVHRGQWSNFRMSDATTNPIAYARDLGITNIFRFALTHPDMDHMDGFDALVGEIGITNYWDTGSRRTKPDFSNCPYFESDWVRYEIVRDGREPGVSTRLRRAGDRFAFANQATDGQSGDGLYILAPDANLVADCNMEDDINDGSYVILYRNPGGRILLPGDAHDNSWAFIRQHYASDVRNCSFLLAPHHGRDSDRSYEFLDLVRPALTLIGCVSSEHVDLDQWRRRGLDYITSDQCGNAVLEQVDDFLAVYVENVDFAISEGEGGHMNSQGYAFLRTISQIREAVAA